MGERGKKTTGKLTVLEPIKRRYPNPQPGMTKNAQAVWHRIVKSFPKDHFRPYQYDLLRAYCEASMSHKKAIKELAKNGEVITQKNGVMKSSPWNEVVSKNAAILASLSVKLGFNEYSTLKNRGKAPAAAKPRSKRSGLIFSK